MDKRRVVAEFEANLDQDRGKFGAYASDSLSDALYDRDRELVVVSERFRTALRNFVMDVCLGARTFLVLDSERHRR